MTDDCQVCEGQDGAVRATGTPELERAVQRLVPLVASASLERAERVRAAKALLAVLEGGDPGTAERIAGELTQRQVPPGPRTAPTSQDEHPQPRGGRLRRRMRAVGDLLDFLNPF